MTSNVKNAINSILGYKNQWEQASKAGDNEAAEKAAQKAKAYYSELEQSGYSDVANKLSASDYSSAKTYADKFLGTSNKTAFRPYVYNEAKKYGISQEDIDKDISFNEITGEVSLGGKNLGRPDAAYDGVSYWSDTDFLSNAVKEYANNINHTDEKNYNILNNEASRKLSEQWEQIGADKADLQNKYSSLYDYSMKDPFATDEGKAIMNKYNLSALNARDNIIAAGAAVNSGNIDSNSAANAMRQQAALVSQGQSAVMDMYNIRTARVQSILDNLSGYNSSVYDAQNTNINNTMINADRLFSNMETAKNNELNRAETAKNNELNRTETAKNNEIIRQQGISDITGNYADWMNNPYFNSDGTLRTTEINYQAEIDKAEQKLAMATEPGEIAKLNQTIKDLNTARNAKITDPSGKWAQYADSMVTYPRSQTESGRQSDINAELEKYAQDTAKEISAGNNAADITMNTADNQTKSAMNAQDNQTKISMNNADNATNFKIAQMKQSKDDEEEKSKDVLSSKEVEEWVEYLDSEYSEMYSGKKALKKSGTNEYTRIADADFIILRVLNSDDLTQKQKDYLLYDKFNIKEDEVNTVLNDKRYR